MEQPLRLPWSQRLCYGVGHALNDLTASVWSSYLIFYLQLVLGFDSNYAGFIMLVGQVAVAIATPWLGYEICTVGGSEVSRKYGKRKLLHLLGSLSVVASFPFIFIVCPGCEDSSELAFTILLVPLVIVYQVGWAAAQVSHLSLIPAVTPYEAERDFLNVLRYAVDIMADISTYIIVWCVFDLTRNSGLNGDYHSITSEYGNKFKIIVLIVVGVGIFFTIIFQVGVKETQNLESEKNTVTENGRNGNAIPLTISWKGWLKEIHFYQIGLLYTFARLFQNMSCVFMPLYLKESLQADDDFIAKIPLIMNVTAFVLSFALPKFFKVFSKRVTFHIGAILGVGSCVWVAIGHGTYFCSHGIYGVGILMGSAATMLVICSLSFTHDLIGTSAETGAFVYGCMSFCDKIANGIGGMLVQIFHSNMCDQCDWFYRDVMSYGVGSTAIIASLLLCILDPTKLGQRSSIYNGAVRNLQREVETGSSNASKDEIKPLLEK